LRVLVAEDNAVWRSLTATLLQERGYGVTIAEDGRQALGALEAGTFDLILLDINMPHVDGFAVTAALRAREMTTQTHVPVIAVTANVMPGDRERCLEAGMDGYVPKPISADALFDEIARVLPSAIPSVPATTRSDHTLARNLVDLFLDAAPGMLAEIRGAAARHDARALRAVVHDLRGAAGVLRVPELSPALVRLQGLARAGAYDDIDAACAEIETALARVSRRVPQ
jgi:CheY-like chemotaxis protein